MLIIAKDNPYDHALNSLLLFMRSNFADVHLLLFAPHERPRENPMLSADALRRCVAKLRPEVILNYGLILHPQEVDEIGELGISLIAFNPGFHSFYCCAPPVTQVEAMRALRKHAAYLVTHLPHIERLRAEGVNAIEFPFWFDPNWFRPLSVPKKFDLLFVGDLTAPLNSSRGEIIERLGKHWQVALASNHAPPISGVLSLGTTADPRRLNLWFNQAKLVLGSDRVADLKVVNCLPEQYIFYTDEFFMRARTPLVLGSGACYVVERYSEIQAKFRDGEEIVLWSSPDELIERVRNLVVNEAERSRIGRNAYARAMAEYTTQRRAEFLARIVQEMPRTHAQGVLS